MNKIELATLIFNLTENELIEALHDIAVSSPEKVIEIKLAAQEALNTTKHLGELRSNMNELTKSEIEYVQICYNQYYHKAYKTFESFLAIKLGDKKRTGTVYE